MDYSFIDKLLERYWQCATSLEEEEMLKAFFRQKEIPQRFEQYRSLFNYEDLAASEHLGADFDEKMIRMVEQPVVRARRIPFAVRFRPFFKAAAAATKRSVNAEAIPSSIIKRFAAAHTCPVF